MAARTTHVKGSLLFYFVPMGILIALGWRYDPIRDTLWVIVGFLLTLYGAEFPDFDQLFKKILNHRDWLSHSAILPLFLSLFALITSNATKEGSINGVYMPILAFFSLGVASHLILDWFPTYKNTTEDGKLEFSDVEYAIKFGIQGLTGEELVQKLVGTYLIHLPFKSIKSGRKTLTAKQTRIYLISNALILILLSIFLFLSFANQYGELPSFLKNLITSL